jgi:3-dehydrosphinganine reductase
MLYAGSHVTIFARKQEQLNQAKEEITSACASDSQIITAVAADMSDPTTVSMESFVLRSYHLRNF